MSRVFVALGSNLGERFENLRRAAGALAPIAASSVYETAPFGPPGQGPYLNAVIEIAPTLPPRPLMRRLLEIEAEMGRVRAEPMGPRIIDLDLILYGDQLIDEDALQLPHPRMHRRAFVLAPLIEIAPGLIHPALNRSIAELAAEADQGPVLGRQERSLLA